MSSTTYVIDIEQAYRDMFSFCKSINLPNERSINLILQLTNEVFDIIDVDELSFMVSLSQKPNLVYYDDVVYQMSPQLMDEFIKHSKAYILSLYTEILLISKKYFPEDISYKYECNLVDVQPNILVFTANRVNKYVQLSDF